MFLSFLSKAGATLNPEMQPLDQLTQQAIGAQSKAGLIDRYNKILSGMLKGEIPTGGKLTLDKDGMKANVPSSALSGPFNEGGGGGQDRGLGGMKSSGTNWDDPANRTDLIGKVRAASPFDSSQLGVSGADLAGLTSQDVSQALKDAIGTASLKEQTINDIAERVYKSQLGKWYEAQTAAVGAPGPLDKPYIIPVNGRQVTVREWNALPEESQKYYMYVFGQELKGKDPMSPREWKMTEPTDRERLLRGIQEDKSLLKTEQDLARARHIEPPEPKPSPVTWTTATNEVTKRFGRLDPTGMWAVTPELQSAHRKAQEFLAESQNTGIDPLRAVNDAENRARNWITDREQRYIEYIEDAQKIKKSSDRKLRISKIQSEFFKQFGYIPSIRR